MKKPDSVLVQEALQGSRTAFRQIVENTQAMVYQVAYRFLGNSHDAEDAVQEVFIRVWKNLKKYNGQAKLSTWLYRIVSNYCLDVLKSRQHRITTASKNEDMLHIADNSLTDGRLNRSQAHQLVLEAAARLTPVQKAVFILRDLEGMRVDEVCQTLAMTPDSIKSNLYHARKKMSQLLKPFQNELL